MSIQSQHSPTIPRKMVTIDDWKSILDGIRQPDSNCESICWVLDTKLRAGCQAKLEERLASQNRQVNQLLDTFKIQDEQHQQRLLNKLENSRKVQQEWRDEQKDRNLSVDQSRCFELLRTIEYESRRNIVDEAEPGTCVRFTNHAR